MTAFMAASTTLASKLPSKGEIIVCYELRANENISCNYDSRAILRQATSKRKSLQQIKRVDANEFHVEFLLAGARP